MKHMKNETIREHLQETLDVANYIIKEKEIDIVLDNILNKIEITRRSKTKKLSKECKSILKDLFINGIYLHDVGKINPKMQLEKFKNNTLNKIKIEKESALNTNHSLLSSILYLDIMDSFLEKLDKEERWFSKYILLNFAFVIYNHHSNLSDLNKWANDLRNKRVNITDFKGYTHFYKKDLNPIFRYDNIFNYIEDENIKFDEYTVNTLCRLFQSMVISCDFIATSNFFNNKKSNIDLGLIKNKEAAIEDFKNTPVYKSIEEYKGNPKSSHISDMNKLRSEMILESEHCLINNLESNIFQLESPTGSGKTIASLNLAMNLLDKTSCNKIFYIFPFNTLAEQTHNTLIDIFKNSLDIQTVNSIAKIKHLENKYGEIDYDLTLLDRQLWNYNTICTSNVNLFNTLFGMSREATMPFFQLCNSIVILDEIQAYKVGIWKEIIEYLYRYSELLNIKIIIMSATLPHLEELISFDVKKITPLIINANKYFQNPIFKNRVEIKGSLLNKKTNKNEKQLLDEIVFQINNRNNLVNTDSKITNSCSKVLVEFIKKKSAQSFEKYVLENLKIKNYIILEIDGDTPTFERLRILELIKSNTQNNIILICTQIIEAGVDIDMDLGFKDISILDSEEQFLGRINRSCQKKHCKAFFFNFDEAQEIYKGDLRINKDISNPIYMKYFVDKNFNQFYKKLMLDIEEDKKSYDKSRSIVDFRKNVKTMAYQTIYEHMQLIDTQTIEVFVPYKLTHSKLNLDGEALWQEFIKLKDDKSLKYSEKRIRMTNLRRLLNNFIFQIHAKDIVGISPVSGIYYIKNGEDFIRNNKLDREKFEEKYSLLK